MSSPVVLVVSDVRVADGYRWHSVPETYLTAVKDGAGCVPLALPALDVDLDTVLERVDGVLLTGARSNIHPSAYFTESTPAHAPFDEDRDRADSRLIHAVLERDLPMFCVCRGLQELNVALGGSIANDIQDLPGRDDHRAVQSTEQDERYQVRQPVAVTPGGLLERAVGAHEINVNSLHRQAIDRLADGLVVEATAPDGTIEAASLPNHRYILGVQWHPEYWFRTDPPSAALFHAFGEAVRG
jgi:putative glutamine amidotransferase